MSSYIGKININNTEYPIAQSLFGTCNTTANTATKVVTCADFDTLISGIVINVYFTYANTESSISLNVNSTGNKTVYVDSNSSILWDAGATKSFVYYNNQWRLINPTSVGTTYDAATTTAAGLMSAADKIKLNGITTGASTYAAGTGLSLSGTTFNHTNSITASSVGSSVATSGATLDIPYAKYDAQGHITEKGVHVHTIGSLAASAITSGTFATARIPNLPTSIITSGTFSTARLPVSTSVGNNNNLPTGAAIQSYVIGLGYGKGTVGGNGTSGYIAKWTGTTAIGNGPQFGGSSATTKFLREDGSWAVPSGGGGGSSSNRVTLFTGDSTGNVTLSSSAANYDLLEIFYEGYNGASPQNMKILNPNGRTVNLSVVEVAQGEGLRIRIARYTISGTSITLGESTWNGYYVFNSNGSFTSTLGTNVIHVTRVDGIIDSTIQTGMGDAY